MLLLSICCRKALSFPHYYPLLRSISCYKNNHNKRQFSNSTTESVKPSPYGNVIYNSSWNTRVKAVKLFSFTTSIAAISLQSILIWKLYLKAGLSAITFVSAGLSGMCFGLFAIVTPVVLHFLVKRHVLQMYFNKETKVFTALRYNFIMMRRPYQFRAEDLDDRDASIGLATVLANGKQSLIFATDKESYLDADAYELLLSNCSNIRKFKRLQEKRKTRQEEDDDDDDQLI